MPMSAPRPCGKAGCAALTQRRFCPEHERQRAQVYDRARGSSAQRGYGAHWRKLRQLILQRDPICRDCKTAASEHVDHIVAKERGGSDDPSNLQGLCRPCHSRKTALHDGRWG